MKLELFLPSEKDLDENERKAHNAAIFAVFPRIEKEIKARMFEQLINTYSENVGTAKTREEIIMTTVKGNGIMEGMGILLESFKIAAQAHEADAQPKEVFDKHSGLSEV